jgi:hypothetical protein
MAYNSRTAIWKSGQWLSGSSTLRINMRMELQMSYSTNMQYGGTWYNGDWYGGIDNMDFKSGTWYGGILDEIRYC